MDRTDLGADDAMSMHTHRMIGCLLSTLVMTACAPPDAISTTSTVPEAETTSPSTTITTNTIPGTTTAPVPPTTSEPTTTSTEEEGDGIFSVPAGPDPPAGPVREYPIYMSLADGDCEAAQAELDEEWDRLRTPRNVLLYQAAIDLCRGSTESGRFWFETAEDSYGWVGVAFEVDEFFYDCEIYRSIRSYFEGGDRAAFACESGDYPRWPDGLEDDPRTSEDESVTTLTTTQADDTTTSTQD